MEKDTEQIESMRNWEKMIVMDKAGLGISTSATILAFQIEISHYNTHLFQLI